MDYGIGSSDDYRHIDHLSPFDTSNDNHALSTYNRQQLKTTQDDSCQMGAEIILKRIIRKLFHQMNELQPNELDDDFIYESSLSFNDYQHILKQIQDDKDSIDCISLNRIENILSKLMSTATIKRPTQTSLFSNFMYLDSMSGSTSLFASDIIGETTSTHLIVILFVVCLLAWIFNQVVGLKGWKSWPVSLFIVGFIEIYLHSMNQVRLSHRQVIERCANPTWMSRIASLINYDYDNCRSATDSPPPPNIAITAMEYISNLISLPLVHVIEKFGKSVERYFNSLTGTNYYIFGFPALVIFILGFGKALSSLLKVWLLQDSQKKNHRGLRSSPQKIMNSPKKLKLNGHHKPAN